MEMKRKHPLVSRVLAVCMVIMMVFSLMPAGFGQTAYADSRSEEQRYEVTINVAPKEATVTFYEGEEAQQQLADGQVTDKGVVSDYHQYVLNVPRGRYSYRAVEGDVDLGGMTFDVPVEEEIMYDPDTGGGKPSGEGQVLTMVRQNYYVNSERIQNIGDYTMRAIPGGMPDAVFGPQYIDDSNHVVTPVMILARGNALVYQVSAEIHGELGETYCVKPMPYETFGGGNAAVPKPLALVGISNYEITSPQGAKTQMFQQINNFNVAEISPKSFVRNDDGTITYQYKASGGEGLTYRVSMEGKLTHAGYFEGVSDSVTVTFGDNEDPSTTEHDVRIQDRMEASTMVNVNRQNALNLGVGNTFRLRAYRAAWQIINTDGGNIMIEPDFHYNVISGGDCIELQPITNTCTGNAGSGENANWMDIRGVKEGTAIIEVSYDAIEIGGDGTTYDGLYGATHPSRKSLIVIKVGGTENTLSLKADGCRYEWDTEYDTFYFVEDTGDLTFTATVEEATPDKVELSTDRGLTWKEVSSADGKYTAEGLVPGNNILKFTKGTTVEYQVIRGAKVTYTITNKTHDIENLYMVGDQVDVHFDGLFMPVPKFSGIYNPGWAGAGNVAYKADGVTQTGTSGQYSFINDNVLTLTLEKAGELVLDDGQIHVGVMGKSNSLNEHRTLTDRGCGINFSAVNVGYICSKVPPIRLNVVEKQESVNIKFQPNADESFSITVKNNKTGMETLVENGEVDLGIGTYSYEAVAKDRERTTGSFRVTPSTTGEIIIPITMRDLDDTEWDGLSAETAPLKDGVYQISKASHLAWFAQQVNSGEGTDWNAVLLNDISLGTRNPWTPMMDYAGTFDGNGHYITNLYINTSRTDNLGLFGATAKGSIIQNLGIDGKITVPDAGGLAGYYIGGIVGYAGKGTTIENCVNHVDISTNDLYVGGIVGRLCNNSSVINCYNTGNVTGNQWTGGLIGQLYTESGEKASFKVKNCYNTGKVQAVSKAGALCYENNGTIARNSFFLENTCNIKLFEGGTKVTSDELKALSPTLGEGYLAGVEGYNNGYPVLAWEEGKLLLLISENAVAELENYKNPADYRDVQQAELAAAVEMAKSAIASAKSIEEVNKAVADAKAAMDQIKTDAQMKAEEEANKPSDTDKPVDTPTTPDADKPADTPVNPPADTPATPDDDKPVDTDQPADTPTTPDADKPEGNKPADTPTTPDADKPEGNKPADTPTTPDADKPEGNKPADTPTTPDADKPAENQPTDEPADKEPVVKKQQLKAPAKVKASNVASTGKIKLTWNKVKNAKEYKVYRATSKNGKYTLMKTVKKTSYINTSAKAGKTYFYKVKAVPKNKNVLTSKYSAVVKRTADLKAPVVTAKNKSKKQVKLTWKKVSGAKKYTVYRATSKNSKYKAIKTTTKLSFTNKNLKKGKTYYYKVKAIAKNSAANSAFSTVDKCKVKK